MQLRTRLESGGTPTARNWGIRVIPVPYEDAMRLGGAVHCMCQALRRDPGAR